MTVVVVNYNGAHLLPDCLDSLAAQTMAHHVIVVDNASTDGSIGLLAADYPGVEVLPQSTNTGFAGGAQIGLEAAGGRYVAFLNNDAHAEPGWLATLAGALEADPDAVAVTSKLLLAADGRINNAGGVIDRLGVGADRGFGKPDDERYARPVEVFGLCGGAAIVRRDAVRSVGGFAREFFLYYEDTDLSWRLRRAGGIVRYEPGAVVHHLHSATTDQHSELFAFHNLRNHLLTLLRNAPAEVFARALLRFLAVTGADVVRRTGDDQHHLPRVRLRVLWSLLKMAPDALRQRRRTNRSARLSAAEVAHEWLGIDDRELTD